MILLLGPTDDTVLANVASRIAARSGEMIVVDPDRGALDLSWSANRGLAGGPVRIGGRMIDVSRLTAVYLRSFGDAGGDTVAQSERAAALWDWTDSLPVLVVNRRQAVHTNMSKPYQQRLIAQHGFSVPRTLVTMMPDAARGFFEECGGRVIYKSISGERSIVKRMGPEDLPRLEQARYCPVQLQELVPGIDVRVHTIGDRLFASEIEADGLDYRYVHQEGGSRSIRAIELPLDVQDRCLLLAAGLGLPVSGIDLRRAPGGEFFCFEVNTSPAFTFYESHTGQRMGDALADLLCAGTWVGEASRHVN